MGPSKPKAQNRLAKEKSPYLLQHAANPVNWYPWGPEAFQKAKFENKLIFLSIGYSTCHWCHVMERESFEHEEIAALLNENFISIKVDREERPDIDQIYMSAVQAMTGSGGWPLTVLLTPEGKPFTGGTYFPPEDRWGRPGMKTILPRMASLWKEKRDEIEQAGNQLAALLQEKGVEEKQSLGAEIFKNAYEQFASHFDSAHGGFGGAPKFPRSHELSFLLRYWLRVKEVRAYGHTPVQMVEVTLDHMARGGMYDQLGGGFHRYSTDETWLVPHFEKMLYDQAILARTYLEAYRVTQNEFFADVARDIFRYVLRDMRNDEGGFYSAEDADSEGEEGKFYVWRPEDVVKILGTDTAQLFNEFYDVTDGGNFEHAHSILHIPETPESFAAAKKIPAADLKKILTISRSKLFEARKQRIPPYKDDKILTAWNGLMISALALGAEVLEDPEYAETAVQAANFILKRLTQNGRLLRRYREGEAAIPAFQDDHAFFGCGLLDLYQATLDIRWLEEAKRITEEMIRLFWDDSQDGFFYTASDHEALIARSKEYYDGALPSGNSMAALLMLRLARITADSSLEKKAEKICESNSDALARYPIGFPQFLIALDFAAGPGREIVITGEKDSAIFKEILKLVRKKITPRDVLIHRPDGKDSNRIEALAGYTKNQISVNGKPTVYVCQNHTCELPITEINELKKLL